MQILQETTLQCHYKIQRWQTPRSFSRRKVKLQGMLTRTGEVSQYREDTTDYKKKKAKEFLLH